MAAYVTANKNAITEFEIPVSWEVFGKVKVQANSLEEAFRYVNEHADEIPLDDDTSYVDGSYRISVDDVDGCIPYQQSNNVVCIEFSCDENLEKYVDSMLFDSTSSGGDSIAHGVFLYNDAKAEIFLDICGEVKVFYKGRAYSRPSEFPKELREHIKANPNNWTVTDCDNDEDLIYVDFNNWFEFIIPDTGDGTVYEDDLSKTTAESVLEEMKKVARHHFGIEN